MLVQLLIGTIATGLTTAIRVAGIVAVISLLRGRLKNRYTPAAAIRFMIGIVLSLLALHTVEVWS